MLYLAFLSAAYLLHDEELPLDARVKVPFPRPPTRLAAGLGWAALRCGSPAEKRVRARSNMKGAQAQGHIATIRAVRPYVTSPALATLCVSTLY